jgi:hypothetical protein
MKNGQKSHRHAQEVMSLCIEDLSLRYIREPLEQQMPAKRCCKMEFTLKCAGVIGLIGLVVGFFVWKKKRRKDTATPTPLGN